MSARGKIRLDLLLVEREIAPSREKAQALILAGRVLVGGHKFEKCGALVEPDSSLQLVGEFPKYVGRGGFKLEGALESWKIDVGGRVCLDIGSSTGGFTDCLLQRGARKVFAVDVGTNQLDWRLRCDPRVVALEETNARYLRFDRIGERVDLITIDASFISANLILPAVLQFLKPRAEILVLVKPQFEAGRERVGKGGVVRDAHIHKEVVGKVAQKLMDLGFSRSASAESVLPGVSGNKEFFIYSVWSGNLCTDSAAL